MTVCLRKIEQYCNDREIERVALNRGKDADRHTDVLTYKRTYTHTQEKIKSDRDTNRGKTLIGYFSCALINNLEEGDIFCITILDGYE